jgi:hypothetical protein
VQTASAVTIASVGALVMEPWVLLHGVVRSAMAEFVARNAVSPSILPAALNVLAALRSPVYTSEFHSWLSSKDRDL